MLDWLFWINLSFEELIDFNCNFGCGCCCCCCWGGIGDVSISDESWGSILFISVLSEIDEPLPNTPRLRGFFFNSCSDARTVSLTSGFEVSGLFGDSDGFGSYSISTLDSIDIWGAFDFLDTTLEFYK